MSNKMRIALLALAVLTVAVAAGGQGSRPASAYSGGSYANITNGTVSMGVWDTGQLNVPGGPSHVPPYTDASYLVNFTGLHYNPTGNESTSPGCLCEGWGAADAITGITGHANEDYGDPVNMTVLSFISDADSATSLVDIGGIMQVKHDYQPSGVTPFLYRVTVSVENTSGNLIHLRYRRVMD